MKNLSIFKKFENIEIYTFEKYFDLTAFDKKKNGSDIIYHFEDGTYDECILWIKEQSIGEEVSVEAFLGRKNIDYDDNPMEFKNGVFYEKKLDINQFDSWFYPLNFYYELAHDLFNINDDTSSSNDTHTTEETIFKDHLDIKSFSIKQTDDYVEYAYTLNNDEKIWKIATTLNAEKKEEFAYEVSYSYEEEGKEHNCFRSIPLLCDLAIFYKKKFQKNFDGETN